MYGKSNMETFITICETDSQWEFALWLWKLKPGSVSISRGGMEWEMGWREGIDIYLWLIHVEV